MDGGGCFDPAKPVAPPARHGLSSRKSNRATNVAKGVKRDEKFCILNGMHQFDG